MIIIRINLYLFISLLLTFSSCEKKAVEPNVLLICVDDLRNELACYGVEKIHTPHIDQLAGEGRLFNKHYVFMAACGPSRSSMLGGKRSYSWDYLSAINRAEDPGSLKEPENPVSLPHLFKKNGYTTVCIGKVSHMPGGLLGNGRPQLPFSWTEVHCPGSDQWKTSWGAEFAYTEGKYFNTVVFESELDSLEPRLPYERGQVDDKGYPDALNADKAIAKLKEFQNNKDPFLLAVGFYKPHLPFNAPEKYWKMYDGMEVARPDCPFPPAYTMPELTLHKSYEPTSHYYWPSGAGNISSQEGEILNQGYWACVSYVDAQIGRVLTALKDLGLDKNTIVVLWSDHGWHLGDHGVWGKYTLHEHSVRSPLIIKVPDMEQQGIPTDALVESVDIYPTLAQLCGLNHPQDLDGISFYESFLHPEIPARKYAYSVVPRDSIIGHSLRSDRYRFMQWMDQESGEIVLHELYDHQEDPGESKNVADQEIELVAEFSRHIEKVRVEP